MATISIELSIEVPESRRVILDLPPEVPPGKAKVEMELTITPVTKVLPGSIPPSPLRSLLGIHKGLDSMEAYFARKRAEKAKEDAMYEQNRKRKRQAKP